jgi:hypothetical protein
MKGAAHFADYMRCVAQTLQGTRIVHKDAVLFMEEERYIGGKAAFMKFVHKRSKAKIDKVRVCSVCALQMLESQTIHAAFSERWMPVHLTERV